MPVIKTRTKVIMDSGREYILDEHPEDFLAKCWDEDTGRMKLGFIHGLGFSLSVGHISSVEGEEYEG